MNDNSLFALRIADLDQAALIAKNWATYTVSILDTDMARNTLGVIDEFYQKYIPQPREAYHLSNFYRLTQTSGVTAGNFQPASTRGVTLVETLTASNNKLDVWTHDWGQWFNRLVFSVSWVLDNFLESDGNAPRHDPAHHK